MMNTSERQLQKIEGAAKAASQGGQRLLGLLEPLGLTVDQELVLLKLRLQLRKLKRREQDKAQAGAFQLVDGLKAGAVDKQALYLLTDAHAQTRRAYQRAEIDAFFTLYSLLTSGQRAALSARMESRALGAKLSPRTHMNRQPSLLAS